MMSFYPKDSGKQPNPNYVPPASKKRKTMENKYCLFCCHSMSSDAPDGSEVLVCFEREGFEGKEIIVGEDECCDNYNGYEF